MWWRAGRGSAMAASEQLSHAVLGRMQAVAQRVVTVAVAYFEYESVLWPERQGGRRSRSGVETRGPGTGTPPRGSK